MARCGCSSGCACLLEGEITDTADVTITGSGSSIDPYHISVDVLTSIEDHDGVGAGSTYTILSANSPVASGVNSVAIGKNAQAGPDETVAIGDTALATGDGSTAIGGFSTASGVASLALAGIASADGATALGAGTASGVGSITIGNGATATIDGAISIGQISNSSGNESVALGYQANASADGAISIGNNSGATATDAIAIGHTARATHITAIALGAGAATTAANQIRLGTASEDVNIPGTLTLDGVLVEPSKVSKNTQAASYSLILSDAGKVVEMNVAGANNLTVPLNASIAFPIDTVIELFQYGAGQTTVVAAGGVTILSSGGKLKLTGQYSAASLRKRNTDEWVLVGDITL